MYGTKECGCASQRVVSRMSRFCGISWDCDDEDVAENLEDYKAHLENEISLLEKKLARIKANSKDNGE